MHEIRYIGGIAFAYVIDVDVDVDVCSDREQYSI